MKRLLVYLALIGAGVCQAEVPKLFTEKNFTAGTLAQAANHYIAIGKDAAIKELTQLAKQDEDSSDSFLGNHISVSERIAWVCRIVFVSDGMHALRPPKYGTLSLPEKYMPDSAWPLYPLALSGSTYVVLGENYNASSNPETAAHYIQYCADNGVFRSNLVAVPTREQALKDALALRQSDQWKSIKWEDPDGMSFPMGEQFTWAFFQNQTKSIVDQPQPVMLAKKQSKAASAVAIAATKPVSPAAPALIVSGNQPEDHHHNPVAENTTHAHSAGSSGGTALVEASTISFH